MYNELHYKVQSLHADELTFYSTTWVFADAEDDVTISKKQTRANLIQHNSIKMVERYVWMTYVTTNLL